MRRVAELDEAIAREAAGRYGVCVGCGGEIGAERLRALPATERCITCATARH